MARETVAGASLMLAEPASDASALRKDMAPPASLTVRALAVFDERGVTDIIAEGARATVDRSAEVARIVSATPRP
ncbi:pyrroline-5-carboxylate reductase dimerization domain-containing protein [Arthrobacter sp. NQ7]|nr:pyrroline-5-carboxylate reductase dimerization domain-containing protein [Arthrobacter sp. NQ7]MDJ0460024.1 pyrroline-5-carboxylate reductase dimerization domain-containing protein [Arthrobacter sp. NQ7]